MKRTIELFLILVLLLSMCGCGVTAGATDPAPDTKDTKMAAETATEAGSETGTPEENTTETPAAGEPAVAETDATPVPIRTPEPIPEITFPDGTVHKTLERRLNLSRMKHEDVASYIEIFQEMPKLRYVNLGKDGRRNFSWEDVGTLQKAFPDVDFEYTYTLFGENLSTLDEIMDLRHIAMDDEGTAVREVLPYMTRCSKLDMDFTGVSSESMAKIRDDFPEMEVVWRIWFGSDCSVRTDAERILASNLNHGLNNANTRDLKYCTKMRLFDVGHNGGLSDFSFMRYMPDLEVVIVSMTGFNDLSVLSGAKNLEFLEFHTVKEGIDLSPLANNTNLEYICCCFEGEVQGWEALKNLTHLKRLWLGFYTHLPEGAVEELRELLPECEINTTNTVGSTGDWRYLPNGEYVPRYALLREQFEYDNYANVCASWFNDPLYADRDGNMYYDYRMWSW